MHPHAAYVQRGWRNQENEQPTRTFYFTAPPRAARRREFCCFRRSRLEAVLALLLVDVVDSVSARQTERQHFSGGYFS